MTRVILVYHPSEHIPLFLKFGQNQSFRAVVEIELKTSWAPDPQNPNEEILVDQYSFVTVEIQNPTQAELDHAQLKQAHLFDVSPAPGSNTPNYSQYFAWRNNNVLPGF